MAFKTSVLKTETQIIVTLEPGDGVDKTDIDALKGCSSAKLDVNGVLKFTIERPKRPLRADILTGESGVGSGAEGAE